ncbi:MAG: DNA cytosine methyltransferase [Pirellulaceae bacterium]
MASTASTKKPSTNGRAKRVVKTFCEFFAGIGLVREGLASSGWQCAYANDIDPKKAEIYGARFGASDHFHLGDVWETDKVVEQIPGAPFMATASFPCTDLSLAGHWRGINGEHSSTFFGFVRVLESLGNRKPSVVVLENVAGFITSNDGKDFAAAVKSLADLGYWIDALLLDARYFVPQSRPRIFVLGVHDRLGPAKSLRPAQAVLFGDARQQMPPVGPLRPMKLVSLMRKVTLPTGWLALNVPTPDENRRPLDDLIDLDDEQEWWDEAAVTKHHDMMSERHRRFVDQLLVDGGLHVGTIFRRKRHGKTRAEIRFDGIAGCLRTPRGGSARQIVIILDNGRLRMRWMSPREYARLQGADDYPLLGNTNQMLFGFGDAVCVPAVRWLDQTILTPLFESAVHKRGLPCRTT